MSPWSREGLGRPVCENRYRSLRGAAVERLTHRSGEALWSGARNESIDCTAMGWHDERAPRGHLTFGNGLGGAIFWEDLRMQQCAADNERGAETCSVSKAQNP